MIELKTTTLERLRISLERIISKQFLEKGIDQTIEIILRETAEDVYFHFFRDLGCMKLNKTISFQFPKTWKDHFKLRHKKNWLIKKRIKKHPIQFTNHKYEVDKMLVFPDFEIPQGNEFKNNFIIYQFIKERDNSKCPR